jgi:outer membrane lipoprotein SlyB
LASWISGQLASAIIGGFIGSTFDTVYGDGHGTIAGAFAGLLAFTCVVSPSLLWLGPVRRTPR